MEDFTFHSLFQMKIKYILIQKILMVSLTIGFFFIFGKDGIILGMAISFLLGFLRVFRGFRETKIDLKLEFLEEKIFDIGE